MNIRKAVLPVGGLGTRFLPATKVVPKELLPVGDKPVIQVLVEEAVQSGITEIILVLSPGKELIRQHFSPQPALEAQLLTRGKTDLLKKIQGLHRLAHFTYVMQPFPLGDGDAVLCAQDEVGNEPFLILFGDDLVKSEVPAAKQLLDQFKGETVIAVERVPKKALSSYGIIEIGKKEGLLYEVRDLVEKPAPADAPSDLGIIGKYVCPPEIFTALKQARHGSDGELRLIDGMKKLKESQKIWAYEIEGERFDTGRPEGWLKANQAFLEMT